MGPLRILIFNQYYPPDRAATARIVAELAEALAARHRVTVVVGHPSYDPVDRLPWRLRCSDDLGGVAVERVGSTAFDRRRGFGRLMNYLSYGLLAIPTGLTKAADVVVVMTDPPFGPIIGAVVARLKRRPLVVNVRDLHPDMAVAAGLLHEGGMVSLWSRLQSWALRQARRVIVLGDDMRRRVIARGAVPEAIVVVRDGCVLGAEGTSQSSPPDPEVRGGFEFVVLHAGNLGFAGAWTTLVGAAKILEGTGIGFVFVGDGAQAGVVRQAAGLGRNIRVLPFRPSGRVAATLAAGDLHVVSVRSGLEGLVVPSKLYSALAAGRPILAVAPETSDVSAIVRESDCGYVVAPDDPRAVASAVFHAFTHRSKLEIMGRRAREVGGQFDRARELERFVQVVEGVAAKPQHVAEVAAGRGGSV